MKIPFKLILKVLTVVDSLLHLLIKGVGALEETLEGVLDEDK